MTRRRVTSRDAVERTAFALFAARGFDGTTVDDIATAAGIGRRTFFRYFPSKNDLVWGDFESRLTAFRALLAAADGDEPLIAVLRHAVLEFNRFPDREEPWHRQRMLLILRVPTLQGDATLRYTAWRAVITDYVAERTGASATSLLPLLAGNVLLAASVSAYEAWLAEDATEPLLTLLDRALRHAAEGLDVALAEHTGERLPRE
ncbi:mycofactocin system transcriptional regulator [Actinocorallia sp. API 0066]|uniref:mycofactocin system transcriptional regulator n=1 Tax=Actinocorallia sp. API 0066 TaxID=2896846 RepID=UPI001E2A847B|nr:mycofactocin system transcriptional regulator [Actinocorallia sp. API 0066]MCD0449684.1 mycofactocin system transcriptional regulator [Actinocorallia sp. API 0066]